MGGRHGSGSAYFPGWDSLDGDLICFFVRVTFDMNPDNAQLVAGERSCNTLTAARVLADQSAREPT